MIAYPFVVVDNCKEELKYYQHVFGGEIVIFRKQGEEVLNAELNFESSKIRFADTLAARPSMKGDYVRVFLEIETEEAFLQIYADLSAGGHINTEVYEAPFNGLLAIVTDQNGICWVLSYYRD